MVQYGTVPSGTTASSTFVLSATDRPLLIGVSSHVAVTWFAALQAVPNGPWLRFADPWSNVQSQAFFAGANGGWGLVPYRPNVAVRIETGAAVSATTSLALIEVHG